MPKNSKKDRKRRDSNGKMKARQTDPNFLPRQPRGMSSRPSTEALIKLMDAGDDHAERLVVLSTVPSQDPNCVFPSTQTDDAPATVDIPTTMTRQEDREKTPTRKQPVTEFITPSGHQNLKFSTPRRGVDTTTFETPGGTKFYLARRMRVDGKQTNLFITSERDPKKSLEVPKDPGLAPEIVKAATFDGQVDVCLSKALLDASTKQIKKNRNKSNAPRYISQAKVMGMSARDALLKAGIEVPKQQAHWLHMIPHAFLADASQTPGNLGIGLKYGNAAMELVNPVIEEILRNNPDMKLYLTAIPHWVPGYESIRLLESIDYIIQDTPGTDPTKSVEFSFPALSKDPVCASEIKAVKDMIRKVFTAPAPDADSDDAPNGDVFQSPNQPFIMTEAKRISNHKRRLFNDDGNPPNEGPAHAKRLIAPKK